MLADISYYELIIQKYAYAGWGVRSKLSWSGHFERTSDHFALPIAAQFQAHERTSALEPKVDSSALKSDHKRLQAPVGLMRNDFKDKWVWSDSISSAMFFFNFLRIFSLRNVGIAESSVLIGDSFKVRWLWSETKSTADSNYQSSLEDFN